MKKRSEAWPDLIEAINLLAKHATDEVSPFHCEHDTLYVQADETKFTAEEIEQLDEWGFFHNTDTGGFMSFRYGSA